MPTLLLDTSFLIDVLNDKRGRADLMERLILDNYTLACCSINVAEVYVGVRMSEAAKTERLLRQLEYIPIGWDAAKLAGDLKREWARKGRTLSVTDTMIAAVCLTEKLTLVTDNGNTSRCPKCPCFLWRTVNNAG